MQINKKVSYKLKVILFDNLTASFTSEKQQQC